MIDDDMAAKEIREWNHVLDGKTKRRKKAARKLDWDSSGLYISRERLPFHGGCASGMFRARDRYYLWCDVEYRKKFVTFVNVILEAHMSSYGWFARIGEEKRRMALSWGVQESDEIKFLRLRGGQWWSPT